MGPVTLDPEAPHHASPLLRTGLDLTTTGVLAAAGLAAASSATATTPAPVARYVDLGDSFSSGESVAPYRAGSGTGIKSCHRSNGAYPDLISKRWNWSSFDFAACSGAITSDLYSPNHSGTKVSVDVLEPAQLSKVGANTHLVTMTIGGNDVGRGRCLRDDDAPDDRRPGGLLPGLPARPLTRATTTGPGRRRGPFAYVLAAQPISRSMSRTVPRPRSSGSSGSGSPLTTQPIDS